MVARCYGGRASKCAPQTVYITHSLTLTRATSASVRGNARRRGVRVRPTTSPTVERLDENASSTRGALTRYTYQWHTPNPDNVLTQLSAVESVPMTISDLETNDRSTNNGYAFFRDVPKWSHSVVPRARPVSVHLPRRLVNPSVHESGRARPRMSAPILKRQTRDQTPDLFQ